MKTYKSLLGMMAVALMVASCSNDISDVQVPEQIAKDGNIHFTATLAPKSFDATTRALVDDPSNNKLISQWVEDEQIMLTYSAGGTTQKVAARVVNVDAETGGAEILATLTGDPTDGTEVDLFYPYDLAEETNPIAEQDGAFSNKLDIRKGTCTIKVDGSEATLAGSIKMKAQYAIVYMNLATVAMSDNLYADKLIIYNGDTKLVTVTPTSSSDASDPYIALPALESDNLRFWAIGERAEGDDDFYFARGTAKLEAGKYYQLEETTLFAEKGTVIGGDGKFYEDATSAGNAGTTAEAVVVWLREGPDADSSDPNGPVLAIALEDYKAEKVTLREAIEASSINSWSNNHKVPYGKWDLPSADDFALICNKLEAVSELRAVTDFPASIVLRTLALRTIITNAGGDEADLKSGSATSQEDNYWTSTTCANNSSYVWTLNAGGSTEDSLAGKFYSETNNADTIERYVRYVLTF